MRRYYKFRTSSKPRPGTSTPAEKYLLEDTLSGFQQDPFRASSSLCSLTQLREAPSYSPTTECPSQIVRSHRLENDGINISRTVVHDTYTMSQVHLVGAYEEFETEF